MIGTVQKNLVPMIMTFDSDDAEFVIMSLADSLNQSYNIIDLFNFPDDDEDIW